ncbi:UNVERIFIED_CONTAM: hypothetical protein FKN15_068256 [Acipenser sinensis]
MREEKGVEVAESTERCEKESIGGSIKANWKKERNYNTKPARKELRYNEPLLTFDDAVSLYNTTLTQIIDTAAALTTRTVKKHCSCPWYTLELRLLKSAFSYVLSSFIVPEKHKPNVP